MLVTSDQTLLDSNLANPLPANSGQPSILVVDNEPAILDMLEMLLEEEYRVSTCIDSACAVQHACEQQPNLILMDILMPEPDGIQVLKTMRRLPELAHIPVVLMTAGIDYRGLSENELLELNAHIIKKPFDNARLMQFLHQVIF